MKCPALLLSLVLLTPVAGYGQDSVVRVVVWDEQQPAQKQAYENFLGNAIAEHLTKQPGLRVISANLSQPDKGLPSTLLDNTDVLSGGGMCDMMKFLRKSHVTSLPESKTDDWL
jgi:hypothetical protein